MLSFRIKKKANYTLKVRIYIFGNIVLDWKSVGMDFNIGPKSTKLTLRNAFNLSGPHFPKHKIRETKSDHF